ncbi:lyase family protein [Mycobacterium xenopi 3993]|nr:lyase family protein [Mycobacterium xenopi 3993]
MRQLIPALEVLHEALTAKAREWRTVVKSGRTHLMDAVPVTLGQEFSGYARQIEAGIERVKATLPGSVSWRSAAPRWAPASTRRRVSAPRLSRCWLPRPGWRNCARRQTLSRHRPLATGWWRRPARCARSRSR